MVSVGLGELVGTPGNRYRHLRRSRRAERGVGVMTNTEDAARYQPGGALFLRHDIHPSLGESTGPRARTVGEPCDIPPEAEVAFRFQRCQPRQGVRMAETCSGLQRHLFSEDLGGSITPAGGRLPHVRGGPADADGPQPTSVGSSEKP